MRSGGDLILHKWDSEETATVSNKTETHFPALSAGATNKHMERASRMASARTLEFTVGLSGPAHLPVQMKLSVATLAEGD